MTAIPDLPDNVRPIGLPTHRTPHPRRCHARKRNGEPCGRWAIAGGTVCTSHGGRAPQVHAAAQLRLLELIMPALATIAREMTTSPLSAVRLRAAQDILDRTGYVRGGNPLAEPDAARSILVARLMDIKEGR